VEIRDKEEAENKKLKAAEKKNSKEENTGTLSNKYSLYKILYNN